MKDKISIIIPVYKVEDCISKCIDSVRFQTYTNWELILVDDGSPDKSGAICDEYAQNDSRIKVFHIVNGGPSNARNIGLDNATGEYVCFIDSDDWVDDAYLQNLYNGITKDGVGVVIGGHKKHEGELVTDRSVGSCVYLKRDFHHIFAEKRIVHWGYTVAKLYNLQEIKKRSLRFDVNLKYCEDLVFFLTFWKDCDWISFIPQTDYHYMIPNTGNTLIVSYNSFESEILGFHRCKECFDELKSITSASDEEINHSYEWCAYMFTRAYKTMYRVGKHKLPYKERMNNLRNMLSPLDILFARRYPYYHQFIDKVVLGLLEKRLYVMSDLCLRLFFSIRYSRLFHGLVRKMIQRA